jgi:hypothetical protein
MRKRKRKGDVSARFRSGFLDTLDGRVAIAKALRHRLGLLMNDLGGLDELSYQEQSLCKRAIHLERLIEKKEEALASGEPVAEVAYFTSINSLVNVLGKIGTKRRPKPVQTLEDYTREKYGTRTPDPDPSNSATDQVSLQATSIDHEIPEAS